MKCECGKEFTPVVYQQDGCEDCIRAAEPGLWDSLMEKPLTECGECGSKSFTVYRNIKNDVILSDAGILETIACNTGDIDSIICKDCGAEYDTMEFKGINL